jgi:hypothetical protein
MVQSHHCFYFLRMQHRYAMFLLCFLKLSVIKIFLKAAVQVENASLGSSFICHKLRQGEDNFSSIITTLV